MQTSPSDSVQRRSNRGVLRLFETPLPSSSPFGWRAADRAADDVLGESLYLLAALFRESGRPSTSFAFVVKESFQEHKDFASRAAQVTKKRGSEKKKKVTYADARLAADAGPDGRVVLQQSTVFPALSKKNRKRQEH